MEISSKERETNYWFDLRRMSLFFNEHATILLLLRIFIKLFGIEFNVSSVKFTTKSMKIWIRFEKTVKIHF